MSPRPLAYIRVSSRAQDHATQRSAIERFAGARGDVVDDWRAEKVSAKTLVRPELARLRADARMGTVGTLYVFKLDRLCRSGVADTFAVLEELRKAGVTVVSVADNLVIRPADEEDTVSTVLIFAFGLAARLERTAINDRISAARDRVEASGGRWGRPSRIDPETAEKMRTMWDNGRGRSVRAIARALKVPRATVGRELARASQKDGPETGADPSEDPVPQ